VKALLIESESLVRERLMGEILELSDVQIEVQDPDDVEEVDQAIAQLHPDVVLIQVDNSRGWGLDIIKRLHARRAEGTPIIVAMASSSSLQYRANCHEAGAAFFFNRLREHDWLLDSLKAIQEELR
jgi:DNA-binding response OmpR family regulator